jgi:hypothetical protein
MKEIITNLYFIEITNFCSGKGNVKRMRKQATDLKKSFGKISSDKRCDYQKKKERKVLLKFHISQSENEQSYFKMAKG